MSLRDWHIWRRAYALACHTPDALRSSRRVLDWLRVPFVGPIAFGDEPGDHELHQFRVEFEVDAQNPYVRHMLDGFISESSSESDETTEYSD